MSKCSSCGACCRVIGNTIQNCDTMIFLYQHAQDESAVEYWSRLKEFPHVINEDGSCSNLLPDNTCAIYDKRPDVCRTDYTFEKLYAKEFTQEKFDNVMKQGCNILQEELNVDEVYRII